MTYKPPARSPEIFVEGAIGGVRVRELKKFTDERGWLMELFRRDELREEFFPVMSYISFTEPGVTRGPHEHAAQADLFCFPGGANFKLRLWDNRAGSDTYMRVMTLIAGRDNPLAVLVPAGVVHAYRNVGEVPGLVINCPNRLYRGEGRRDPVDEVRHEDDPRSIFSMDD